MTTICGAEEISDIFSVFHDGVITGHGIIAGNLELVVNISYLAQRLHPDYRCFRVALLDVQDVRFTTWPKDAAPPATRRSLPEIFVPDLHILIGECDGDRITVICNQPARESAHCGGELHFSAAGAVVTDEAGKAYAIPGLYALAHAYWDEWSSREGK